MPKTTCKSFWIAGATALVLLMGQTVSATENKNVMFVLDASNSMWGQIDGKAKIEIAKSVLQDLAARMPEGAKMGLVAYGHRFDRKLKECDDMELMNPIGHFNAAEAPNAFSFITPKGQTPIARTLNETANWLQEQKGQDNTVVLISDGLESCDEDPCAAAKALNDAGVTTSIHVVGFDLSAQQRAKLECIANNGNGKMFAANDASSLSEAMNKVRQEVAQPALVVVAEAPKAEQQQELETTFEDQFEGSGLADGWEVVNANEDRYVAETGELLIIAAPPASDPAQEDMVNVITHSAALPDGDWEMEVQLKLEAQHGGEAFSFGVMNDHDGWMSAGIRSTMAYGKVLLESFIAKNEKGQIARFDTPVGEVGDTGSSQTTQRWKSSGLGEKFSKKPFNLVLRKQGRSYSMSGTYADKEDENFKEFKTETLKMLRGKKKLFIAFGLAKHGRDYQGEGNVLVDYVRVRRLVGG